MMNPNEYDTMVEHLAAEIIEDVFEKSAATGNVAKLTKKELAALTPEQQAVYKKNIGKVMKENKAINSAANPAYKRYGIKKGKGIKATGNGYVPPAKTLKERFAETAAGKELAGYSQKARSAGEKAHDKALALRYGDFGASSEARKASGKAFADWAKSHPIATGTGAGLAVAGLGAGAYAAYRHNKKNKEEQKEKVAAYYEDALEKSAAAENVWAFADQFEDSYESLLMKQAAEELFEEAQAQAEAAENVYDAIENDYIENDYIDDDYEGDDE